MHEPGDSLLQHRHVEVEEQAEGALAESEVREEFRLVNLDDLPHGLDFDDDPVGHQEVDPISAVDPDAVVCDGHGNLSVEWEASFRQLVGQASLVDRFE